MGTLFGWTLDSCGEKVENQERFRAEVERGSRMEAFCIVIGGDPSSLRALAQERWERRAAKDGGPTFKPERVLEILWSFWVDLDVPHFWAGSHWGAERMVGTMLTRAWEQAHGGKAAEKARARGSVRGWLPVAAPDPNALRVPARGMNRDGSMPEGSDEG